MILTHHFSFEEATITSTGLPNHPTPEQLERVQWTALQMEIVRATLGRYPIKVSSWFRSPQVNAAVGGVASSEHTLGAAVDFTCAQHGTPLQVCETLRMYAPTLNYNQLIYEGTWVHISFPPPSTKGKLEVLTMKNGKYYRGLVP